MLYWWLFVSVVLWSDAVFVVCVSVLLWSDAVFVVCVSVVLWSDAVFAMYVSVVLWSDAVCVVCVSVVVRCGAVGVTDPGSHSLPRGRQLGHHPLPQSRTPHATTQLLSQHAVSFIIFNFSFNFETEVSTVYNPIVI